MIDLKSIRHPLAEDFRHDLDLTGIRDDAGVVNKELERITAAGIATVYDLMMRIPLRYIDRSEITPRPARGQIRWPDWCRPGCHIAGGPELGGSGPFVVGRTTTRQRLCLSSHRCLFHGIRRGGARYWDGILE
ncbi:hypothetical protein [Rhodococcus qingshengii]|uniref:Uncharacterized protein n=1 Tax=Rhodococcus qingshengii TaxID=334542 RepID=A0A2A5IX77_RHOSG|nr:hypothetical protein [Rhodococcus qingshengii]PCK21351.1 hypothetical protein CHR55_34065 [Rhodococcus qingshengii]